MHYTVQTSGTRTLQLVRRATQANSELRVPEVNAIGPDLSSLHSGNANEDQATASEGQKPIQVPILGTSAVAIKLILMATADGSWANSLSFRLPME